MRKLYVMSKPFDNRPRLIGILSEEDGKYFFEYKLGGSFPEFFLCLEEFPYADKKYEGKEVKQFVMSFIPERDNIYIKGLMKTAGVKEYDEWELLKGLGRINPQETAFLYEELPEGAIIYETLGRTEE